MMRSIALAILVGAASATLVGAQEARVRFVFRSNSVGFFEHKMTVQGAEANRLLAPNPSDLKPYLLAAQKALAEREGYSEKLYGAKHHTLASGRLVESTVTDVTGRMLYTSRDPVENRVREPRALKPIRTFEADEPPDDVVGFAPVGSRAARTRRQAQSTVRQLPFLKRSGD